jgi:hypothetical protein
MVSLKVGVEESHGTLYVTWRIILPYHGAFLEILTISFMHMKRRGERFVRPVDKWIQKSYS